MHKSFKLANFKALDEGTGAFEAIVSVFGNVDLIGDRVVKGAFTKSLKEWQDSGDPIPVIWSHQWDNPDAHIGFVTPTDAKEVDEGLYVKGQIDTGKTFAAHVFDLLKERRVKEFSFAYDVVDSVTTQEDGKRVTELTELSIIEVGPTLKGMNPATQLLAAKSALEKSELTREQVRELFGAKAGRVLSAKNEDMIKQASDLLQQVLASVQAENEDDAAKAEEPSGAKAEESREYPDFADLVRTTSE